MTRNVESYVGGRNLMTAHAPEDYPGLSLFSPGPSWGKVSFILGQDGVTIVAKGGERIYAYETVDGGQAQGFELRPGDRATLVRSGLLYAMVEWRVERAGE